MKNCRWTANLARAAALAISLLAAVGPAGGQVPENVEDLDIVRYNRSAQVQDAIGRWVTAKADAVRRIAGYPTSEELTRARARAYDLLRASIPDGGRIGTGPDGGKCRVSLDWDMAISVYSGGQRAGYRPNFSEHPATMNAAGTELAAEYEASSNSVRSENVGVGINSFASPIGGVVTTAIRLSVPVFSSSPRIHRSLKVRRENATTRFEVTERTAGQPQPDVDAICSF